MAIRTYKPTSPATRQLRTVLNKDLHKGAPEKALVEALSRSGGRNNNGRITCRHVGGGHKRKYRIIDFKRNKMDIPAVISRIEYDPNRTAHIALLSYIDGEKRYILCPDGVKVGMEIHNSEKADIKAGNAMMLKNVPIGTVLHNVELKPGKGGQMARTAGSSVQLLGRDKGMASLRLPSGEIRLVMEICRATIGVVGNSEHGKINLGKAGRKRWLGVRPTVRGVVMNPVDHPHGGGEGRTSGGRHPVTPWGRPTKGYKTRKNKTTNKYIVRRRKK